MPIVNVEVASSTEFKFAISHRRIPVNKFNIPGPAPQSSENLLIKKNSNLYSYKSFIGYGYSLYSVSIIIMASCSNRKRPADQITLLTYFNRRPKVSISMFFCLFSRHIKIIFLFKRTTPMQKRIHSSDVKLFYRKLPMIDSQ